MTDIFDVAKWFLSKEPMSPKKVQKLCYYYKAWGLALYGQDFLPKDEFQAWIHGPVNPSLYRKYKEYYWNDIPQGEDNSGLFNNEQKDILDSVWGSYGDMSANALECQTHIEAPWKETRGDLKEFDQCEKPIENALMMDYYRKLYRDTQGD